MAFLPNFDQILALPPGPLVQSKEKNLIKGINCKSWNFSKCFGPAISWLHLTLA